MDDREVTTEKTDNMTYTSEPEMPDEETPQQRMVQMEEFMALAMNRMVPEADISSKLTEGHIDKMLDNDRLQIQEKRVSVREQGIIRIIMTLIGAGLFIAVICILKDQPEVMEKVICTAGGFLAGALGGYGYGKTKSNQNDDE